MILSPLYAIVDSEILAAREIPLQQFAECLCSAGATLLQYRDKRSSPQQILQNAATLWSACAGTSATFLLNDRPDLAILAQAAGVHVGQDDLYPAHARQVIGPARILGVSTHSDAQVRAAAATSADYIAIGPVFATRSKLNPDPIIGLEGIRRTRALTSKPLVAIGGITRANARSVIDAGADSVAVISGLLPPGENIAQVVRDFIDILR